MKVCVFCGELESTREPLATRNSSKPETTAKLNATKTIPTH